MKQSRTGFLALALMLTAHAHAQVWCPPGAQWSHVTLLAEGDGVYETLVGRYVGDTLIAGRSAQHIRQFRYLADWGGGEPVLDAVSDQYTWNDSDLVLAWNAPAGTFDTLFWFGAEVGDIWPAFAPGMPGVQGWFRVLDKTVVDLSGLPLRRMEVSIEVVFEDGGLTLDVDTLYERIGLMHNNFIYRDMFNSFPAGMCYLDDVFSWSNTGSMDNCDLTLSVPRRDPVPALGVYPNPATDNIRVEGVLTGDRGILVFHDATGRECLVSEMPNDGGMVDVSDLKPGLYTVSLRGTELRMHLRFVKE